jgi:hypothetical protein
MALITAGHALVRPANRAPFGWAAVDLPQGQAVVEPRFYVEGSKAIRPARADRGLRGTIFRR